MHLCLGDYCSVKFAVLPQRQIGVVLDWFSVTKNQAKNKLFALNFKQDKNVLTNFTISIQFIGL